MIDDLLDLTRISRGTLQLSLATADIHSLLTHTEEIVRSDADTKRVELQFQLKAAEHHVVGDSGRLHQVFWNVLKNAIKFTPSGGSIIVRTANPVAGQIRLEFTDTGIGIEEEFRASVFQPFVQGDVRPDSALSGLGLGMSISKTIVELHDGTIDVASTDRGHGATFVVELATTAANEAAATAPRRPLSSSRHTYRLLVVEDHQPTLQVLARLLRKQGHDVQTASTVEAARDFAANQEFDLVISDIGLPVGNGVDLMTELTRDYGLRGIALSGYGMDEDFARTRDAGFIAHLVKPIDFERLNHVLEQVASA